MLSDIAPLSSFSEKFALKLARWNSCISSLRFSTHRRSQKIISKPSLPIYLQQNLCKDCLKIPKHDTRPNTSSCVTRNELLITNHDEYCLKSLSIRYYAAPCVYMCRSVSLLRREPPTSLPTLSSPATKRRSWVPNCGVPQLSLPGNHRGIHGKAVMIEFWRYGIRLEL